MDVLPSIPEWRAELGRRFPQLSRPQAKVLCWWSVGVLLAKSCGQCQVSQVLADLLHCKFEAVRQRLREFCYEASAKCGPRRRALEVEPCFAPLLAWVLSLWPSRDLVLVLDPTSLRDRLVVLAISVVYRGTAVPVAWHVVRGATPEAWQPHWLALLERVRAEVPQDYRVLVLTDRGLYAPWLFEAIAAAGWHPFMRINAGGFFTPAGQARQTLTSFAPEPGTHCAARGVAFTNRPVACTLLARWEQGGKDPWRVLTDLSPQEARVSWYGLRAWIEQGFKDLKRGGLHWHATRMNEPERVARFWLVLAVVALWTLAVGGREEVASTTSRPPRAHSAGNGPARRRRLSVFCRGCAKLLACLLQGRARLPDMAFVPEPWPDPLPSRHWKPG